MANKCDHKNPLNRDGTSQLQRKLRYLDPASIQLDDRSTEDLLKFAHQFASELKYFNLENIAQGNWQGFFEIVQQKTLSEIEEQSNNEPHFALFLCFLKLFQHAQNQLNNLSERHLDFYYKKVLQIKEKAAQSDQVHLVCELAKNLNQHLLEAGTNINGGKDDSGKLRVYQIDEDTVLNRGSVSHIRSIFSKNQKLYFAPFANSSDGMGAEFENGIPKWSAFGHDDLPRASTGFALASPVLLLQEGTRTIRLIFNLTSSTEMPSTLDSGILSNIKLYASGEKDWLGPFIANDSSTFVKDNNNKSHPQFILAFDIPKESDPIIAYNPNVLSGNFDSLSPMVRVVFEPLENENLFDKLQRAQIRSLKIEVKVNEMQELVVENDLGKLDPSKPFMPFGPRPVLGSNFFIGSKEAFTKKLKNFDLNLQWQNKPDSLKDHYGSYSNSKFGNGVTQYSISGDKDFEAEIKMLSKKNWESSFSKKLFDDDTSSRTISKSFSSSNDETGNRPSKSSTRAKRVKTRQFLARRKFNPFFERALGSIRPIAYFKTQKRALLKTAKPTVLSNVNNNQRDGFIKLRLSKDFGHQVFPTLYSLAIASQTDTVTTNNINVPLEPYTPMLESLNLNYEATTEIVDMGIDSNNEQKYEDREIQFFHLSPFGQAEQHRYLKNQLPFTTTKNISLLPEFQNEGELYIGLKDIEPQNNISLLFQVAEGSANPDKEPPAVKWHLLVNDHWMPLDESQILADQTNGLLTSGIVQFYLPKEANDTNSLFEENHYWLKASIQKDTDAVAQLQGIHAQVVKATFVDQENTLEHLETALAPSSISKLINPIAQIKKIEQPYASFDGVPAESSDAYYTRVSERLRHKNRAITIWDYEHLILQNFPSIYKVKCLNHSSLDLEIAPGHVTVLVIPNLQNQNAKDPLQPKASSNTLSEIEKFLRKRASRFVNIQTQNPDYEEIKLELKVTFRKKFEAGFYKKVLNEDLKSFFTPWAFDSKADIHFGGKIHKSTIINFLEGLEYVDNIRDLKMFHINKQKVTSLVKNEVSVSNSRAILVSAKQHSIN